MNDELDLRPIIVVYRQPVREHFPLIEPLAWPTYQQARAILLRRLALNLQRFAAGMSETLREAAASIRDAASAISELNAVLSQCPVDDWETPEGEDG